VGGSEFCIGEAPPSLSQTDNQIRKSKLSCRLKQKQQPVGTQKCSDVCERLAQVGGCVQCICRNHHIEAMRAEALLQWLLFEIQHPICNERVSRKRLPCFRPE
jgi:hypothetical protein